MNSTILSLILVTPLIGALLIALLPERGKLPQALALITALITFLFTLHLPAHFDYTQSGFQFVQNIALFPSGPNIPAIRYHLGVDGLSLWLVVLTGLLAPIGVLASWRTITTRTKVFYSLFLVQQTAMAGVFVALDLMLYYGFWELSLVPMAILIAMYGRTKAADPNAGPGGPSAATRFFLYTFIPSAPLLVAILWLYAKTHSFDFEVVRASIFYNTLDAHALGWVALAFLIAFAVKVPVLGLHGWLPDVFQEAPVAMGMIVAGKLGLYSLIRFHVGLFPVQARAAAPYLIALGAIGILYGALLALVQKDFWKLLAYATLSSLSFCTLGIYGFTLTGLDGSVYQTLNEGIIGAALFVLFGVLYDRFGTSQISIFGGLAQRTPSLVTVFVISSLALIGLPMLNGFVGEFLVLSSTFTWVNRSWAIAATLGVILSAAYMLTLIQRVFYGPPSGAVTANPHSNAALDLSFNEKLITFSLAVLMLVMGIFPNLFLNGIETQTRETIRWTSLKPWTKADCTNHPCKFQVRFFLGANTPQPGDPIPSAGDQQ
jgi:NADH-quinone oxidoreductase subunit M